MDAQVIVVGAGPVGLTAAIELRRRGVDVLIVDKRDDVAPWAKAVGIQPRTLEIWDQVGIVDRMLNASQSMLGQVVYVNGEKTGEMRLSVPPEVPYGFICLPQYATEEILGAHLADLGTPLRRGVELVAVRQDEESVTASLRDRSGETREVTAAYLVAAEGAHSLVRKSLGLEFSGDAFPEEYMLADVELDWSVEPGMSVRSSHVTDGVVDDVLVCIPLPGRCRYRISMLVPPELSAAANDTTAGQSGVAHGIQTEGPKPQLHHVQAVLDRLAPEPTTASALRWSSVFRISHRLVNRYSDGRVFLAGDTAHIHPPTGAQGMNTGVQDAYNLGWKLALAAQAVAAPCLLDSYHAERHPVGEEVVGRTVRAAREGLGAGDDPQTAVLRTAQLLVHYADSPIVAADGEVPGGPIPGERAPDATGLRRSAVTGPVRFHETLRHPGHTLLLWATTEAAWRQAQDVAAEVSATVSGHVLSVIAVPAALEAAGVAGDTVVDAEATLAAAYGFGESADVPAAVLIRPDGYLSYRSAAVTADRVIAHLRATTLNV